MLPFEGAVVYGHNFRVSFHNEVMVNLHRLFGIRKENVMLCRWIQSLDPW
jgi:hypothetical protein